MSVAVLMPKALRNSLAGTAFLSLFPVKHAARRFPSNIPTPHEIISATVPRRRSEKPLADGEASTSATIIEEILTQPKKARMKIRKATHPAAKISGQDAFLIQRGADKIFMSNYNAGAYGGQFYSDIKIEVTIS